AEESEKELMRKSFRRQTDAWEVVMYEGFEGAFPADNGWDVFDADPTNGYDYWDDVSCYSSTGSWSGWCADMGDMADCSQYDNYMVSWMIYGPFDLSCAVDADILYDLWLDSEPGYDYFKVLASINGTNFYGYQYDGNTGGWSTGMEFDLTDVYTIGNLTGQPNVWIAFIFQSDNIISSYGGAYLDEIEVWRDCVGCQPDLWVDWLNYYPDPVCLDGILYNEIQVTNYGCSPTAEQNIDIYISTNNIISTLDTKIFWWIIPSLPSGGYATGAPVAWDLTPFGFLPGIYYYGAHDPVKGVYYLAGSLEIIDCQAGPCSTCVSQDYFSGPYIPGSACFDVSNCGDPASSMSYSASVISGGGWLNIYSGATGGNSGTVCFDIDENTGCDPRNGVIEVTSNCPNSPVYVDIHQDGYPDCHTCVDPGNRNVDCNIGATSFNVTNCGCGSMSYSADVTSGGNWCVISAGATGGNSGTIVVAYSANPTGAARIADITVTSNCPNSPVVVTVTQDPGPCGGECASISIDPYEQTVSPGVGTAIALDIWIGDPDPVTNFLGVSFHLSWDQPAYVGYDTHTLGPFLGTGPIGLVQPFADHIEAGLTRTIGGVSGSGLVLYLDLEVIATPPSLPLIVELTIDNITAMDSSGNPLCIDPYPSPPPTAICTIDVACQAVWPGDANNNCSVSAADILPLGLFYGNNSGDVRPGGNCSWGEQCYPTPPYLQWSPTNAMYADCNGDGTVNAADVLCIGLNYGLSHTCPRELNKTYINTDSEEKPSLGFNIYNKSGSLTSISQLENGDEFYLGIRAADVENLTGIAFSIETGGAGRSIGAEVMEEWGENGTELGEIWNEGAMKISKVFREDGLIEVGITNPGNTMQKSNGEIARIKMRLIDKDVLKMEIKEVEGMNGIGESLMMKGSLIDGKFAIEKTGKDISKLSLSSFPNPFNPTTKIRFSLPDKHRVHLSVYNSIGEEIVRLVDGLDLDKGIYTFDWDASEYSSGVYFYVLKTDREVISDKLLLMK
ncbi:BACON domain-containing protein, partial [Bacteroidota bacterium]